MLEGIHHSRVSNVTVRGQDCICATHLSTTGMLQSRLKIRAGAALKLLFLILCITITPMYSHRRKISFRGLLACEFECLQNHTSCTKSKEANWSVRETATQKFQAATHTYTHPIPISSKSLKNAYLQKDREQLDPSLVSTSSSSSSAQLLQRSHNIDSAERHGSVRRKETGKNVRLENNKNVAQHRRHTKSESTGDKEGRGKSEPKKSRKT